MKLLPAWLADYRAKSFRPDIVAGFTLSAYLLPSALGDASLANLPPESGLYACMAAGLFFWLFSSSHQTAISVTSGLSLLVGASLGDLAGGDPSRFAALAACTALLVGVLALLAWLAQAGVLVNFISETVLVGFKFGIALVLISTQLPKLCGFHGSHGNFWERVGYIAEHIQETNQLSLLVGLSAILLLILGKIYLKHKPVSLFVLIAGIASSRVFDLSGRGVKLLGEVPQGLPTIALPGVQLSDINQLLPLALACFLLGSVETAAIGRMFALKHNYRFDPNREFLALAAANTASAFAGGFPVSGGMSQSLVNESAGARTPLSGLIAALITVLVALFLSGMLRNLPQPVLAAIVLMAVTGLMKFKTLISLWRFSREEFLIAVVAVIGVLGSGVLRGVLIGAVLTILLLLRRASRPHTTELGRVPGSNYFSDRIRHPENQPEPEVFVFRLEGALLYFNVDHTRDRFLELLNQRPDAIRVAVFYLGMVPFIDMAGLETLSELQRLMKARLIDFRLAETHGQVREALRRGSFEEHYGPITANQTVKAVIAEWRQGCSESVCE